MNKWTLFGLTVLGIALTLQTVSAITCFKCNSKSDPGCDTSPVDLKYKTDCSELKDGSKYDRCRKISQWVDKEMDGLKPDSRIVRDCGINQGVDERTCYYRAGFGGRQQVCSCTSEDCNAASKLGSTVFAIIASIAICAFNLVH